LLLTTAICESVVDGAAQAESDGWFDENDLPPWDTWVCYARLGTRPFTSHETLVAVVPPAWQDAAGRGIRVNPLDCIQWATPEDIAAIEAIE
jgi:hypothetical protein